MSKLSQGADESLAILFVIPHVYEGIESRVAVSQPECKLEAPRGNTVTAAECIQRVKEVK